MKAEEFKKHAEKMRFTTENNETLAIVLNDGTLKLMRSSKDEWYINSGMKPEEALALGRCLVEMYEDKNEANEDN